ncbi:MAG: PEP/pyruvate-binding domain-containing protein [Polyangiales bacterium]
MERPRALPLALLLALGACSAPAPTPPGDAGPGDAPADGPDVPIGAYDDHTVDRLASRADFDARATAEHGFASQKLVITNFSDRAARDLRFYDSRFYALHDEWYWFRLLNGQRVPGESVDPVPGLRFPTVASIYDWARRQPRLPLDLAFGDGRLYSWRFYEHSFDAARWFGLATLVNVPARAAPPASPERWAFELEYSDHATYEDLVVFFEQIRARVPDDIARELRFLVRSAEQEQLAQRMEREHLPYWDKILRYRDLVVPGAREVYSEGVAAGRLRFLRDGVGLDTTTPSDIVATDFIPDYLPAAAGLLTAVPQTPLAHVNLLARNRGIPNAYLAGALDDPTLTQVERGWGAVVFRAELPDRVTVTQITEEQYRRYLSLVARPARAVMAPPVATLPYVIDLRTRTQADQESLVPAIGGKSSGMIALIHEPGVAAPDAPHAITIRAYTEHVAPLRERIAAVLADPFFAADPRARRLLLEGQEAYRARHSNAQDLSFLESLLAARPAGTLIGDLARANGVRGLVESTPIAPATLREIFGALSAAYADLAVTQGIRFRSSSNAEDIEGFNGAGLYESFTGFLDAGAQSGADRQKTVERAILRVWGSYWSFEATEERRNAQIDHLSGAMGVLVHPRFDDALERATGVCIFNVLPPNSPDAERLDVNVQLGAESVANPDPTMLPEVATVARARGSDVLRVTRVRASTLSPAQQLLTDDALRALFTETASLAHRWLDRENASRPAARRARMVTLDIEFHDMRAGWPAMRTGPQRPARLVLKQSRTLEPAPPAIAAAATWPVPRDVLGRARRVSAQTCSGDGVTVRLLRVLTDASLSPDVGYATTAFDASVTVATEAPFPALGWTAAQSFATEHVGFTAARSATGRVFTVAMPGMGPDRIELGDDGALTLGRGAMTWSGHTTCIEEPLWASPRDYLLELAAGRASP